MAAAGYLDPAGFSYTEDTSVDCGSGGLNPGAVA